MVLIRCYVVLAVLLWSGVLAHGGTKDSKDKKPAKKKDVRDYTEADLERLYEQWEEDEEPLEEDELPEHKRKPPQLDLSKIDTSNPENVLKLSKKGKTLMAFVTVSGSPSKEELEQVTGLWQTSLYNAHVDVQRYVVDENRAIFMFKDGSQAWEAKDFLVKQDKCAEVTIEGRSYPGKAAPKEKNDKKGSDSKKHKEL